MANPNEELAKEVKKLTETIELLHTLLEDVVITNKELVSELSKLKTEMINLREK